MKETINENFIHKDIDFIKQVYENSEKKMRWHADIEYKLLNMFIIIYPIIITSLIGVSKYLDDKDIYLFLAVSMAFFIFVLTLLIDKKVKHEHNTYEKIGGQIVRIWEYFGLFEKDFYLRCNSILSDTARNYGKGDGHKKTLNILWAMSITTASILILFGLVNYYLL